MGRFVKSVLLITIGFGIGLTIMVGLLDLDPREWIYGPTPPPRLAVGAVTATSGEAETRFAQRGDWTLLEAKRDLAAHDEMRTGPTSWVGATFKEGAQFVLSEYTHVSVRAEADDLGRVESLQLGCLTGTIRLESDQTLTVPLTLQLMGLSATQIPGGRLVLVEEDDGRSLLSFTGAGGKLKTRDGEIPIPVGYGVVFRDGELLSDPIRLPDPPTPRTPRVRDTIRFRESSLVRVIIARDEKMLDVAAEVNGQNGSAKLALPAGKYHAMAATREPSTGLVGGYGKPFDLEVTR